MPGRKLAEILIIDKLSTLARSRPSSRVVEGPHWDGEVVDSIQDLGHTDSAKLAPIAPLLDLIIESQTWDEMRGHMTTEQISHA